MTSTGLSVRWWPCSCICEVYSGTSQFLLTKKGTMRPHRSSQRRNEAAKTRHPIAATAGSSTNSSEMATPPLRQSAFPRVQKPKQGAQPKIYMTFVSRGLRTMSSTSRKDVLSSRDRTKMGSIIWYRTTNPSVLVSRLWQGFDFATTSKGGLQAWVCHIWNWPEMDINDGGMCQACMTATTAKEFFGSVYWL
jgi:hypothetical protein